MSEKVLIYSTKYALTKGITKHLATAAGRDMMRIDSECPYYLHGLGQEWHRSFQCAKMRAEKMRVAKIASLRKQIYRLERLCFDREGE